MAEPKDIVLGFLRKNGFAKAEAAFKAELVERETIERQEISSENVMNWDLLLPRIAVQDADNKMNTPKEQRTGNSPEERESDFPPGRVVFPPEKQLFVEYEPGKAEPQISPEIVMVSTESGTSISFDTIKSSVQQSRKWLTTAKDTSSFEWKPTGGNQTNNANDEPTEQSSVEDNDGESQPHQLPQDDSSANIWDVPQVTEYMPAKNNFLASSTRGGYFKAPPVKTCLPTSFMKHSQQEEQLGMLFPYGVDLRNQNSGIGNEDVGTFETNALITGSALVGHLSIPEKIDSSSNGVQEELSRLPPVKLHVIGSSPDPAQPEDFSNKFEYNLPSGAYGWTAITDGKLLDEASSSGLIQPIVRPSVSQGIVEVMSDPLSGFAIPSGIHGERWCGDEYCDSDTYEDDDDPGYLRQPIEDEEWFLTHEIDYPSDNERVRQFVEKNAVPAFKQSKKIDENRHTFIDEESYFLGEECFNPQATKEGRQRLQNSEFGHIELTSYNNDNNSSPYSERIDETGESGFVGLQPSWKGFIGQLNNIKETDEIFGGDKFLGGSVDAIKDYNHGYARSGGIQANSDAADDGSEVRGSSLGGSSEADLDIIGKQDIPLYDSAPTNIITESQRHHENNEPAKEVEDEEDEQDMILQYYDEAWGYSKRSSASKNTDIVQGGSSKKLSRNKNSMSCTDKVIPQSDGFVFEGFSFPSPSSTGEVAVSTAGSGKSIWSNRASPAAVEDIDLYGNGILGPDNTLAAWKRKGDNSSPIIRSSDEGTKNRNMTKQFPESSHWTNYFESVEARECGSELEAGVESPTEFKPSTQEEGDTVVVQERPVGVDEDQFEIFNLRIIHRKNRTGFEEEKDFPVLINSVVAGRYHVTEYLGSAAFSKAIQAHDLHTGMDVCMKIIKNNKDFFDQSLDEIKLLKFVNKHDPADKYHVLRLYDYFYHREHLFIICELLRANLYEFHKFNRESGGEVYFTMPRLQSITRQCLEALEFLHGLGIIHCDLKPENILVKSYSRCEIKIIDLGSSCFQTDHLCSYVQSRSYRAPEVILGLPYDQKIDIWSLGCILAELCTGNVLFQNDSLATLLARVVGILGPIDPDVLAKGRDTHKYFTKNHMLYERNQDTDRLEYLLPKKTSLRHRMPMGDQGFVEFVGFLLQSDPAKRPTAAEAIHHPWLSFPYEPISC